MDGPTRMVFFLVVNDANSNKFLTWLQNVEINNQFNIASPKNWESCITIPSSLPRMATKLAVVDLSLLISKHMVILSVPLSKIVSDNTSTKI